MFNFDDDLLFGVITIVLSAMVILLSLLYIDLSNKVNSLVNDDNRIIYVVIDNDFERSNYDFF